MKKMKLLMALIMGGSLLLSGCFVDINDDDGLFGCIDADGPITTIDLQLEDIDGIELAMDARVELTQGPEQSITVEGKSDIFDELDLDVRNGVWKIRTEDCVRDVDDLTFFITLPNLRVVKVSGSGEVFSTNTFDSGNDIELRISGSGELDLSLLADDIEADISGSGKMILEGEADELDLRITGSGDLRGFDLSTREVDINISGSGDAEVRVSDRLDVFITGSGDVFYKGNPTLDVSITGSGEVIDAN